MKVYFGHCAGCDQPIRPPYLSLVVSMNYAPDGNSRASWEDADVCDECARKLTVRDLHRLVGAEEADTAIADTHPKDGDVKQAPLVSGGGSEGNRP